MIPLVKKYCLIGNPINHSLSPQIFNSIFKKSHNNCKYQLLYSNDIESAVQLIKKHQFKGISVTYPYKMDIINYVDNMDYHAKNIGAVNTLVNKNGILSAYNTDYLGFYNAMKKIIRIKKFNILIIGNGATARSIVYGLLKNISNLYIVGRNYKTLSIFKEWYLKISENLNNIYCFTKLNNMLYNKNIDYIINTSPISINNIINTYYSINTPILNVNYNEQVNSINYTKYNKKFAKLFLLEQALLQYKIWFN